MRAADNDGDDDDVKDYDYDGLAGIDKAPATSPRVVAMCEKFSVL